MCIHPRSAVHAIVTALAFACTASAASPQTSQPGATEKARAKEMLASVKSAIRENYYDRTYRGIDVDAHFKDADKKLDAAVSQGHACAIIAQALIDFNDSHTFFLPPPRPETFEYGWKMRVGGDDTYVIAVKPGSDAEAKGLKAGDRVLTSDAFTP